jgi:hypothetical protein
MPPAGGEFSHPGDIAERLEGADRSEKSLSAILPKAVSPLLKSGLAIVPNPIFLCSWGNVWQHCQQQFSQVL